MLSNQDKNNKICENQCEECDFVVAAVTHCIECDENFCKTCDNRVHNKNKRRTHQRVNIQTKTEPNINKNDLQLFTTSSESAYFQILFVFEIQKYHTKQQLPKFMHSNKVSREQLSQYAMVFFHDFQSYSNSQIRAQIKQYFLNENISEHLIQEQSMKSSNQNGTINFILDAVKEKYSQIECSHIQQSLVFDYLYLVSPTICSQKIIDVQKIYASLDQSLIKPKTCIIYMQPATFEKLVAFPLSQEEIFSISNSSQQSQFNNNANSQEEINNLQQIGSHISELTFGGGEHNIFQNTLTKSKNSKYTISQSSKSIDEVQKITKAQEKMLKMVKITQEQNIHIQKNNKDYENVEIFEQQQQKLQQQCFGDFIQIKTESSKSIQEQNQLEQKINKSEDKINSNSDDDNGEENISYISGNYSPSGIQQVHPHIQNVKQTRTSSQEQLNYIYQYSNNKQDSTQATFNYQNLQDMSINQIISQQRKMTDEVRKSQYQIIQCQYSQKNLLPLQQLNVQTMVLPSPLNSNYKQENISYYQTQQSQNSFTNIQQSPINTSQHQLQCNPIFIPEIQPFPDQSMLEPRIQEIVNLTRFILKEFAYKGEIFIEKEIFIKSLFDKLIENEQIFQVRHVKEIQQITNYLENIKIIHTIKRQFGDFPQVFQYICMYIENPSLESLYWCLLYLQKEKITPNEKNIFNKFKECYGMKIQPYVQQCILLYLVQSARNNEIYPQHTNQIPVLTIDQCPMQMEGSKICNNMKQQLQTVIGIKGSNYECEDQIPLDPVADFQIWQDFIIFIEQFFYVESVSNISKSQKQKWSTSIQSSALNSCSQQNQKQRKSQIIPPKSLARAIPGGKYGAASFLKLCGPLSLQNCSLGKLCSLIQEALLRQFLVYHKTLLIKSINLSVNLDLNIQIQPNNLSLTKQCSKSDLSDNFELIDISTSQNSYKQIQNNIANLNPMARQKLEYIQKILIQILRNHPKGVALSKLPKIIQQHNLNFQFDLHELGFKRLKPLLQTIEDVEIIEIDSPNKSLNGGQKSQYAKLKQFNQRQLVSPTSQISNSQQSYLSPQDQIIFYNQYFNAQNQEQENLIFNQELDNKPKKQMNLRAQEYQLDVIQRLNETEEKLSFLQDSKIEDNYNFVQHPNNDEQNSKIENQFFNNISKEQQQIRKFSDNLIYQSNNLNEVNELFDKNQLNTGNSYMQKKQKQVFRTNSDATAYKNKVNNVIKYVVTQEKYKVIGVEIKELYNQLCLILNKSTELGINFGLLGSLSFEKYLIEQCNEFIDIAFINYKMMLFPKYGYGVQQQMNQQLSLQQKKLESQNLDQANAIMKGYIYETPPMKGRQEGFSNFQYQTTEGHSEFKQLEKKYAIPQQNIFFSHQSPSKVDNGNSDGKAIDLNKFIDQKDQDLIKFKCQQIFPQNRNLQQFQRKNENSRQYWDEQNQCIEENLKASLQIKNSNIVSQRYFNEIETEKH